MIRSLFLDHPRSVDESYLRHAAFAGRFALRLLAASGAAAIHALVPCLFDKTASRMIADLHAQTQRAVRRSQVPASLSPPKVLGAAAFAASLRAAR